jgi:hypothetical protein
MNLCYILARWFSFPFFLFNKMLLRDNIYCTWLFLYPSTVTYKRWYVQQNIHFRDTVEGVALGSDAGSISVRSVGYQWWQIKHFRPTNRAIYIFLHYLCCRLVMKEIRSIRSIPCNLCNGRYYQDWKLSIERALVSSIPFFCYKSWLMFGQVHICVCCLGPATKISHCWASLYEEKIFVAPKLKLINTKLANS